MGLLGSVEDIAARRQTVLKRWAEFKEVAAQRRAKLQDSKKLQQFTRNCDELESWIASRLTIASEEAHKDTTNLQVDKLHCFGTLTSALLFFFFFVFFFFWVG